MTKNITPLTTWEGFALLSHAAFHERFPDASIGRRRLSDPDDDDDEEDDEYGERENDDGLPWLLVSGSVSIGTGMLKAVEGQAWSRIVVDGDLHIDESGAALRWGDPLGQVGFVSGDLHVDMIRLDDMPSNAVAGLVVAKSAWLFAEDDCCMRRAPELRLDTPFLFAWFYRVDQLALNPGAVIFILGDGDYCAGLGLPNPVFAWHDAVHVLEKRFVDRVICDGYDGHAWRHDTIIPALRRGRSIFKDGIDIACHPFHRAARAAMAAGDHRSAYLLYKKSAVIAPAYYHAWCGMAQALVREGAWGQALGVYRKAATLFPPEQTGMINTALNHAALCALRTGRPGVAIELASMSIKHNLGRADKERATGAAFRYRAEAYLMSGEPGAALDDLRQALGRDRHLSAAYWLKGLAHYQRNESEQARAAHAQACEHDERYAASYDTHGDTGFLSRAGTRVDWDHDGAAVPG
ncbi:tetratricopeptide repeat protein [Massilia antarctica]|uniref:Tetratricopeptide repeat protein n=1 Tax=Massilia antarctica TaxID=2765360 RepID=A0AA48W8V9_9BURK|nr:tetratricopeptide repeat protein [Massilia antarctica]QPI48102.1 tetratricopeptide repeat protein [Massilia antarctica]